MGNQNYVLSCESANHLSKRLGASHRVLGVYEKRSDALWAVASHLEVCQPWRARFGSRISASMIMRNEVPVQDRDLINDSFFFEVFLLTDLSCVASDPPFVESNPRRVTRISWKMLQECPHK